MITKKVALPWMFEVPGSPSETAWEHVLGGGLWLGSPDEVSSWGGHCGAYGAVVEMSHVSWMVLEAIIDTAQKPHLTGASMAPN